MKKAQVDPLKIVVLFIILAVVAGIVIWMFNSYFGKETEIVGGQISGLQEDKDNDGLVNTIDPCPCDPTNTKNENGVCAKPC